jgi:TM2 domain-containing membrane protein YozV
MFSSTQQIQPSDPPKNPIIAAVLSLILLGGVGQIYLGQTKKGIIIIVVTLLLSCVGIGFIIWIVGIIDAYIMADKLQKGEAIGDMQWFWEK